jgi:hypothetical protein
MAAAARRPPAGVAQMGSIYIASETADTVTVVFSGDRRVHDFEKIEEQWEFWPGVTQRCRSLGIRRVLVLNELSGPISSNYVRDFHTDLGRYGLDPGSRYAMVVRDRRSRSVLSLGIALAKQAGWDIEIFEKETVARAWLARPMAPSPEEPGADAE